ncbi:two-component system sensor histidine kinase NtrB [Desulfobulbus elongatus]|uniref:two-component system sensor histidine kinase NtrB n=1 Tax=Desulfobulbus elongatus TaxID=53332 RepID=UPI0004826C8D|nr:ATP-binding protein [Desulfobulbus elongatus]
MMTRFLQRFNPQASMASSPWLLAAAAGLLLMIVVTFAFHNLRLEERLMTNSMLQKASTLMRVLHSGSRASYFNDLRKDFWNNEPWNVHIQRVIDHLIEDPELSFVALIDAKGKVIAHSNHDRVGASEPFLLPKEGEGEAEEHPQLFYRIEDTSDFGRVFATIRHFPAAFPAMAPLLARPMHEGQKGFMGSMSREPEERRPPLRIFPEGLSSGGQLYVVVGLDMKEFDRTLGRMRMQIFMLSLAMLLVGFGGWFSLLAVQGYRVSQKTLGDMQAFTSLLIAKLPVGVIATDTTGRITTWNRAMAQLTGIEQSGATGRRPQEILPEQLAALFPPDDLPPGQQISTTEHAVRLMVGGRRCELLCHPLTIVDSEQQYMGKVLLISDVTEIRSMEQRMRESERLAAVGRMAGGVAHEVRNPLSSIKGLALLLKNKFSAGSKEQDTADLLIQETERMNRTITEMLSFTRPAALHLGRVDLAGLMRRSLELIKTEASENGVETFLDARADLLPVLGDVDRLQQVVMNVLLNALQAMELGGTLSVALANGVDGQWVEARIRDTGAGIAPDLLSQVFFPYFTTKQKGTGIGLAISQKIVAEHGGTIELESEYGTGTTVTIQLPAYRLEE